LWVIIAGCWSLSRPNRSAFGGAHTDFYFDTRPETVEHRDEPVSREASEIGMANARKIGRRDAGPRLRTSHRQALPVQGFNNLGGKDCPELSGVRIDPTDISERIAAPTYDFYFLFSPHVNISFNCFNRFLTSSISRGAV
jgi:hypothetical protein